MAFALATLILSIASAAAPTLEAATPVGWRGDGSGHFAEAAPVLEWSATKNVLWATPMPGWSNSLPILVDGKLYVGSETDTLLCLDAKTGKILWAKTNPESDTLDKAEIARRAELVKKLAPQAAERDKLNREKRTLRGKVRKDPKDAAAKEALGKVNARLKELARELKPLAGVKRPSTHGTNGYSTPTPVSDGKYVYAMFGTGVVACYTLDGKRKWIQVVDKPTRGHGHSASPALAGGKLIVAYRDLIALDPATGKQAWKTRSRACWGSPVVTKIGETPVIVSAAGQAVRASDGTVLSKGLVNLNFNSPMVHDGVVYTFDQRQKAQAHQLPAEASENMDVQPLWTTDVKTDRYYASPAYLDGLVYGVTQKGVLAVLDAKSGQKVYEKKLAMGKGTFYPSPTVAGGHVFISVDSGTTIVLKPERQYREIARNTLEPFRSSPVFIGGRMYVRGLKKLYCIGK